MRLPIDVDGSDLIKALGRIGYGIVRQIRSHVRLVRTTPEGADHIAVPLSSPLRVGTFNAILTDVAHHIGLERDELMRRIY
jgi:predicted RNA binding protein YcfA (HicA-like mRNA interferase family)